MKWIAIVCALASAASATPRVASTETTPSPTVKVDTDDPLAKYFAELAAMKLIDVESGTLETLKRELAVGEA
ncbi:MAG TPA: hypothetical protein VFS15_12125, partial [Kofleriaceae bacterium]|nr:hypothetical protein [Kofleriaceae bacterium]